MESIPTTIYPRTFANIPKSPSHVHTVLVRSHGQRIRFGAVTNSGASQHPNLVLCPAFQLVQNDEGGIVQRCDCCFAVRTARLNQKHFIVNDASARSFDGRIPFQSDGRRTGCLCCYITWRSTRN